jgi:phosphatidylinositol alpha-mannosyltransferase
VDFFANAKPFPEYRDGKTNILFVGRLEPRKGARYLVEAYAKLKQRYPDTRLIVCGRGPELGDLRELVHREHVSDVLFAGRVSETDKARFYKTADVFCAPSTGQESFGIVLLEAMAAGTAAIASDIHGYKKVIQRNLSGLLVEPRDVDALCSALERLVTEPALRKQLGERGSIRAREFDWSHVTDQLLAFYDKVIRAYRSA